MKVSRASVPQSSLVGDLKSLLELVSKPDRMKELLESLHEEVKRLETLEKSIAEKQDRLQKFDDESAVRAKRCSELEAELGEKTKHLAKVSEAIKDREMKVAARDKLFDREKQEFEAHKLDMTEKLYEQTKQVEKMKAEAASAKSEAEAVVESYNLKAASLKAALGG